MNLTIDNIIELYRYSEELTILLNAEKNIVFINKSAENIFGTPKNVKEIEHNFTFNVCILDRDRFIDYNPLQEALLSNICFKAETFYQVDNNSYRNLNLRSFDIKEYKILIFSDVTEKIVNQTLLYSAQDSENIILKLEKENKESSELREKAVTLAIRTGLVNKISRKIRDSFDIKEIIETIVAEIKDTLGLNHGFYTPKSDLDAVDAVSSIINDTSTGQTRQKLVTPVTYHNEVHGILSFIHSEPGRQWHTEEINLIEGIASQLASAINQAILFTEVEKKKTDLENALYELKDAQTKLVQSEKMASLGQLVAGVAHEINTPIGSINSNNDILIKCLGKIKNNPGEIKKYVQLIEETMLINSEAVKRVNSIVKALKNFARLDESEIKEVDIHEGINSTLMLISHELKGKIKISKEFGCLPQVKCYPNLLNQVFMNILVNAVQSIDKHGEITIKTEYADGKVLIRISDTGKGIPKADIDKIFNPGFTTKGVGIGTGLGLSICYQIIDKHKGNIKVDSILDQGTIFTIELPVNPEL